MKLICAKRCNKTLVTRLRKRRLKKRGFVMKLCIQNSVRLSVLTVAVASLGVFASACNSNSNSSSPAAPQVQQEQGPAWKLVYQSDAGTADKTTVVGAYGFTVFADQQFQVGPSPDGQTLHGKLSDDEFSAIESALQPVLTGEALSQAQNCGPSQISDHDDSLTFVKGSSSNTFLTKKNDTSEGTVCANGYTVDDAEALRTAVIAAATDHYALPFPSACLTAASAVQALYSGLGQCSQDSDCTYVDPSDYSAIPADQSMNVFVDNCSVIQSLPVANTAALAAHATALNAALLNAQTTCGADNILRSGCTGQVFFNSATAPAACIHGACAVNPQLQL
jgi:hypothetical protein